MSRKTRPLIYRDANNNPLTFTELNTELRVEYSGTSPLYLGFARPGAAEGDLEWSISKFAVDGSGNITSRKWPEAASGSPSSDNEFSWTSRATYTYS